MTDNASIAADIAEMNRLMKVYATFDAESLIAKVLDAEIDRLSDVIDAALKVETPDLVTRLVPAGGMALTAEQVEDVRTVAWYTGAGLSRAPMAEIHRLRALFPATEPAEADEARLQRNPETVARIKSALASTDGDTEIPAPAEPAEEETKAEHNASVARREALGRVAQQLYEQSFDGCDGTFYHDFGRALEDFLPSQGWVRIPASSPVVPAPTETEWQTWQEVPEGVQYYGINGWGPTYYVNRGGVRYRVFDDTPSKTADYVVQNFAPFVAAEEG